jgi:ABC-type phosphate transport system substrate-binding protein
MKLTDIFYQFRTRIQNVWRLGRLNPFTASGRQAIMTEARRIAINKAQQVNVSNFNQQQSPPQQSESSPNQSSSSSPVQTPTPIPTPTPFVTPSTPSQASPPFSPPPLIPTATQYHRSPYPEYSCKTDDPLGCHFPHTTIQQAPQAKFCSGCGFMVPLLENQEIRGRRGIYQVTRVGISQGNQLLRKRGMGRLYEGIRRNDNQAIVIKEFLLPNRCFKKLEDIQHRQGTFVSMANLTSADGRDRDFRLLIPWEAIADETERRCYLITQGNLEALPSLKNYLSEQGKMNNEQVKNLLDQVLQSLEFIHGQRFNFASGQIQEGLIHGNLSLESVLISVNQQNFFVYLTDLLLWEYLFYHPDMIIEDKTIADDLKATGEIGLGMLLGLATTGEALDPRNEQAWLGVDTHLKNFILQLLGIESPFPTANAAREVLRQLPKPQIEEFTPPKLEADSEQSKRHRLWPWLVTPAVLILVFGSGWLIRNLIIKSSQVVPITGELCCDMESIQEVNVPAGEFTYTTEKEGNVNYIFLTPIGGFPSLIDELQSLKSGLILDYKPVRTPQAVLQKVAGETANFGMINQIQTSTPSTVISKTVAYDGLLIVVPFTASTRKESLSQALQGKISFKQVQDLYTGKIKNWRELGGPDIPVKLYMPPDPFAIEVFEKKVLQDDAIIAQFRSLMQQGMIEERETIPNMSDLQREFEHSNIGGISFGFASKIFGQCGGYPLALVESENWWLSFLKKILFIDSSGVVPYVNTVDGESITPKFDLCYDKGGYRLATEQFQTQVYPLAFPVVVIYPLTNQDEPQYQIGQKFAQMLTTYEGQKLLQQRNLVPLPTQPPKN